MKIAVVADVLSEDGYLTTWLNYYSNVVGYENIFLYSYQTQIAFSTVLPVPYCDRYRRIFMINRVTELLKTYDIVLRVDIDEFLVPHAGDLKTFLNGLTVDYVTAKGFNVFNRRENDLDHTRPLMEQRKFMFADMREYKTCVTRIPLAWQEGFHSCDKPIHFHDLYILHMKHADHQHEQFWRQKMSAYSYVKDYYSKVIPRRENFPLAFDINRESFDQKFVSLTQKHTGLLRNDLESEPVNLLIPDFLKVF